MLTPQEVKEKKFKQSFINGYDMTTVDGFLESLTEDYTTLFKENAVLKNKMKVLVDKLEEYRNQEDSIRQAYIAIKKQAESELTRARDEVKAIMTEAYGAAETQKAQITMQLSEEQKRLRTAQEQTAAFVKALRELYARQIEQLSLIHAVQTSHMANETNSENVSEQPRVVEAPHIRTAESKREENTQTVNNAYNNNASSTRENGRNDINEMVQKRMDEKISSFQINFEPGVLPDETENTWKPAHATEAHQPRYDFHANQFGTENN